MRHISKRGSWKLDGVTYAPGLAIRSELAGSGLLDNRIHRGCLSVVASYAKVPDDAEKTDEKEEESDPS